MFCAKSKKEIDSLVDVRMPPSWWGCDISFPAATKCACRHDWECECEWDLRSWSLFLCHIVDAVEEFVKLWGENSGLFMGW